VGNGSGLSRGDRNRNARLARLRELVPVHHAIVGIDLADNTQAAVVTDHDSRVIARRRVSARAWELGELLDWAVARAAAAGFSSVTVACEPTGHRWRVLDQLAAGRGLALVCVQPLLVYRAREGEDLTRDKSDPKDAVLIARLAGELRCYEPERASAVWARLRHLGARRNQLTTAATAAVNQIRDLLECAWPAVLAASGSPFRSVTWCASLAVVPAGAPGTCAGSGGWAWTGSPRRCGGSCPGGAGGGRACGSSGRCSRRWRIRPGSPRIGPVRWSARTWRWATGGIPAPA
jgi:transposase